MKVHLIKKQSIEDFIKNHQDSFSGFNNFLNLVKHADWNNPGEIIKTFNSSDILGDGTKRVVFNIAGNKYRMICKYQFGNNKVHLFVKWIGTHAEYTKLCNDGKQYDISEY